MVCRNIEQRRHIEQLEARLRKYEGHKSAAEAAPGEFRERSLSSLHRTELALVKRSIHKLHADEHEFHTLDLLPRQKAVRKTINLKELAHFHPVSPEAIYLRMSSLEKEIKRHEPDLYFKIKEFTLEDDDSVSYLDINRFAEEISHLIFRKKKINPQYLRIPEADFQHLVEELCFEIMYRKLLGDENEEHEVKNFQLQEKLFILQNIITPKMIGIKPDHFAFNIYHMASAGSHELPELKKINSVKSPVNKCQVIIQSVNCLCSNLNLLGLYKNKMPSAEELFPALVYLLIGANPHHIALNLQYIDKYLPPTRKIEKEGYILANIGAALNFLQKIDSNALLAGKVQISAR